ncbi:type IV pilus modification protein PilV [Marinobacterium sp. D7]|nr:type IV pilus modification protein PilV [Marinobacterium ramblicola]
MAEKGITLIEILVALLVISVGLLGVSGMLAFTVKSSHSSYLRSQATMLAYELTDAMRAAPGDAKDGLFNDDCNDNGVACSFRHEWDNWVKNRLGSGATGTISWTGDRLTVQMTWNDYRGAVVNAQGDEGVGNNSDSQTFQFETEI